MKLEEDILKALDFEDRSSSAKTASTRSWRRGRRAILAYGLVLAIGAALTLSYFILRAPHRKTPEATSEPASAPAAVARDYQNYQAEKLPLMLETGDVKELERFFSAAGVAFNTRVFDLGMMDYHLAGGRVHRLVERQSALFVYRREDNRIVICQMYPGQAPELPSTGASLRENEGIRFYIYRVNGLRVAFWQEGAVICVLTSDIALEEVIQLAFAKAVKI